MADDIIGTLDSALSRTLLGLEESNSRRHDGVARNLEDLLKQSTEIETTSRKVVEIAKAAVCAFIQATVTGPPLAWDARKVVPREALVPSSSGSEEESFLHLLAFLSVDGEAVYQRLPYIELFVFAKILLNFTGLHQDIEQLQTRLRVNTWHQRLLNQPSPALEKEIYEDLRAVSELITSGVSR